MTQQIQEAFNNIKDRFKNSFIVTFIFVWAIVHWELVYSILNFDNNEIRKSKVEFIHQYIKNHSMLWEPFWISIISLIVLYAVFILSDVIHDAYNLTRNNVLKFFKSKKVISIEVYNALGKELDRIRTRAGEYQIKESNYILSKKDLESSVTELTLKLSNKEKEFDLINAEVTQYNNLKGKINEFENNAKISIQRISSLTKEIEDLNNALATEKSAIKAATEALSDSNLSKLDLNAFKFWIGSQHFDLLKSWDEIGIKKREEVVNTYVSDNSFKKIFGSDTWLKKELLDGHVVRSSSIKLTNDFVPKFISNYGENYSVSKIRFDSASNTFDYTLNNVENRGVIKCSMEVLNKDEILAHEGGNQYLITRQE